MKSLIAGLLIIAALASSVFAASTDTAKPEIDVVDLSMAVTLAKLGATVVEKVPVEQKVVELHMSSKPSYTMPESGKRRRKAETLPFRSGTCSGSFINDKGDILTARHCVDGYDVFEVETYDRRKYSAVVVATSTVHDLALIHIDRRNTAFFELADTSYRGQKIFVLGSPLGITDTLSTGIIARIDGDATLLDCSALPGNSGGPVFDTDQKIVGVLNAGYMWGFGVTHLNMAQGLDAVHFFLKEALEKKYGHR